MEEKLWRAIVVEMPRLATDGAAPFIHITRAQIGSQPRNKTLDEILSEISAKKRKRLAQTPGVHESVAPAAPGEIAGPHFKETVYVSDAVHVEQQSGSRWRGSDPSHWKRNNVRKLKKISGETHRKSLNQEVQERHPVDLGVHECTFQCKQFSEEDRERLCAEFWKLANYERQKDFLLSNVVSGDVQRRRVRAEDETPRKNQSYSHHFSLNGVRLRVCKPFFMATLNINKSQVYNAFKQQSPCGLFEGVDGRGRKTSANKLSKEAVQKIKDQIGSFPKMESHYCQKSTKRQYHLECDLTVKKMYQLYREKLEGDGDRPARFSKYKEFLGTEYNLGFWSPS